MKMFKNKLVVVLVFLFVFLAVPKPKPTPVLSETNTSLSFASAMPELHVFPEKRLLDLESGDFEELVNLLYDFLIYSPLYEVKVAVPEGYLFKGDLDEFVSEFLPASNFSKSDIVSYPEEEFKEGDFVFWLNASKGISQKFSILESVDRLKREERALLKESWLTKTKEKNLPFDMLQEGWVVVEHPYRAPKKEFLDLENVRFLELDLGVNVDFLKKDPVPWAGKMKISEIEELVGSFCFSFCSENEKIGRFPIFFKIKDGKTTHWSSGYPPIGWLFDE